MPDKKSNKTHPCDCCNDKNKIIKYKCGICNEKIKNYCVCKILETIKNQNYSTKSNVTVIAGTPTDSDKYKERIIEKGEKGERGLTGTMGLPGNSFLIFSTSTQIKPNDFIGYGVVDSVFDKVTIIVPYDFFIKQIGFTIRKTTTSKCKIILYINGEPSGFTVCICDGISQIVNFNAGTKIKSNDLIAFRVCFDYGILEYGISITMVVNY